MDANVSQDYLDLVELAKANISGPLQRQFIAKAQRQLVSRLLERGLIEADDVADLEM